MIWCVRLCNIVNFKLGKTDKIMELLLEGYDHILDVVDENGLLITEVIKSRGDTEMSNLLASIPAFEVIKYIHLS